MSRLEEGTRETKKPGTGPALAITNTTMDQFLLGTAE